MLITKKEVEEVLVRIILVIGLSYPCYYNPQIENKDEEESLDGSTPSGDHIEGTCITRKSERLDTTAIAAGGEQEKVDISSDEENRSVSFVLHNVLPFILTLSLIQILFNVCPLIPQQ